MESGITEKQIKAAIMCLSPEYVAYMAAKLSIEGGGMGERLMLWASLIREMESEAGMSAAEIVKAADA